MKTTKVCRSADEALTMANAEIETLESRLAWAEEMLRDAEAKFRNLAEGEDSEPWLTARDWLADLERGPPSP